MTVKERRTQGLGFDAFEIDWRSLWIEFGDQYVRRVQRPLTLVTDPLAIHELIFCLLGGYGVSYELGLSATRRIVTLKPLSNAWAASDLGQRVEYELGLAQFEPRRADGSLRRYRFPHERARRVVAAIEWVRKLDVSLYGYLSSFDCEYARREALIRCPGIGLKSASWLLRNLGLAHNLAVLDIHVTRAIITAGRIAEVSLPRDYVAVEREYIRWCEEIHAAPAAFDLMLWECQRWLAAKSMSW
jgi:N-glycosylase/DNA lyase